jgi:hypothetical protein
MGRLLRIKRMSNKKYLKDEVFLTEEEQEEEHRILDSGDFRSRGFIKLS